MDELELQYEPQQRKRKNYGLEGYKKAVKGTLREFRDRNFRSNRGERHPTKWHEVQ